MVQNMLNFLSNELLESSITNVILILSIITSFILGVRHIYFSFTYDNFDILFHPKAKKQGILHIKTIATTLFLSILIFLFMVLIPLLASTSIYLMIFIFFFTLLGLLLAILAIIFDLIRIRFKVLLNKNTIDELKERKILYISAFCLFLGILFILVTIDFTSITVMSDQITLINDEAFIYRSWLSSFGLSLAITIYFQTGVQAQSIKYLFIGTYSNRLPCNLYFDYTINNTTHILSSEDKLYRAVKYINPDNGYSIYLYKKTSLPTTTK